MVDEILAAAAVVVGLAAAYFAWRTIPPKRELTITMTSTPLLNRSDSDVDQQLRVVHEKLGDLADPRVVVLTIRNSGRAAIASAHYDANQPLPLELGQPILQLIQAVSRGRVGMKVPQSMLKNGTLRIGPGLIHRKQLLTYTVLVDGEPKLNVERNLVDVEIKISDPDITPWRPHLAIERALLVCTGMIAFYPLLMRDITAALSAVVPFAATTFVLAVVDTWQASSDGRAPFSGPFGKRSLSEHSDPG